VKTIVQKVRFPTSAKKLYEIFLDSKKHSAATGGKAVAGKKVGDRFTAWDGYITGKNLVLVPGRVIVQAWRTSEFKKTDPDSVLTLTLEESGGSTTLTMVHAAVPDHKADDFKSGWHEHYWKPIKKYFQG